MEKESMRVTTIPESLHREYVLPEEELVIKNAKNIKREFVLALAGSQHLVIVLKQVTKIDLSVIQLLIGLQKSAAAMDRTVSYRFEQPDYIKPLMEHSGFGEILIENFKKAE